MNESSASLAQFFGRMHLLLVHLPIGIILLLAALELLALLPRFRNAVASARVIAFLAVPAAVLSVACGWLLAQGGGYDPTLLERHRWMGLAVAVAALFTWFLHWSGSRGFYRFALAGTVVLLTVASHLGGSLTHGQDFLTRHAPEPLRTWLGGTPKEAATSAGESVAEPPAFEVAVRPILDKYCVACHGPEKTKGGLRADSVESLLKGGESGVSVLAGHSAESLLIKRLLLPMNHDDHMPPEGKPQPSVQEVAALRWWIDAGASPDKSLEQLKAPVEILQLARPGVSQATPTAPDENVLKAAEPKPVEEVMPIAQQLMDALGVSISPIAAGEPWLQCNASLAVEAFGDAELASLAPLASNLRWLDLGGTRVSDTGAVHLAGMPHLWRLHLNNTAVTDLALTNLAGLKELAYLNLHHTRITDEGLTHLEKLPALRQLYLWQSQVTPGAAADFAERRTDRIQIQQWQQEIATLEFRIRQQAMLVNTGAPITLAQTTNASPINTQCPVSGKPVDKTKTAVYDGKVVAFCCDQCKAAFEKDPKPHLGKLGLTPPAETAAPK